MKESQPFKTAAFALVLFALVLIIAQQTYAANRTTGDNFIDAEKRTVSKELKMYSLSLTDATVSNIDLQADVKTAAVRCVGEDVLLNVSYYDGVESAQSIGDLITTGTDKRILRAFDGVTMFLAQNTEYTHVYGRVADSSGTATCYIFPGGGYSQ